MSVRHCQPVPSCLSEADRQPASHSHALAAKRLVLDPWLSRGSTLACLCLASLVTWLRIGHFSPCRPVVQQSAPVQAFIVSLSRAIDVLGAMWDLPSSCPMCGVYVTKELPGGFTPAMNAGKCRLLKACCLPGLRGQGDRGRPPPRDGARSAPLISGPWAFPCPPITTLLIMSPFSISHPQHVCIFQ